MRYGCKWLLGIIAAALLLSGCAMRTVDELYSPPKRSEEYNDLQMAMDSVMANLEYCAPLSGENRQTVQMADLNGDGEQEFLLFARGTGEKPLNILIFHHVDGDFQLAHTIESSGYAFDLVEYVQMDERPGLELVVGRQVSEQILRSVCVYSFADEAVETVLSTQYSKFLTCDLDEDTYSEVLVLRPGQADTDNGVAELYRCGDEGIERSMEVSMSEPVDQIKRIMESRLVGGAPAVYVASAVEGGAIITDVFSVVNGSFSNVSFSNESGTSVKTLRNYYVYASDIDDDGVIELPSLISMRALSWKEPRDREYLIRWYAMAADGTEVDKKYTYHNYAGGWYLQLADDWGPRVVVEHEKSGYNEDRFVFYVWNETFTQAEKLLTLSVLTGTDREEEAMTGDRIILHKTDSSIFAAVLEEIASDYGLSQQSLIDAFSLIRLDWKTGEM